MGSAALACAAQRGLRAIGLEQFERGHEFGASSGRTRMIRKAYFENAAYVPMVLRAYDKWRELEDLTGERLLHLTGLLMIGDPDSATIRGTLDAARVHGLRVENLDAADVARRFPMFRMQSSDAALYEAEGGFVVPERAIAALLSVAESSGAILQFGTRVNRWNRLPAGGVRLALGDGSHVDAARVALCAGPWLASVAQDLGVSVEIQRNVQHWFEPAEPGLSEGSFPSFFCDRADLPGRLYGFPDSGFGVKAALHGYGVLSSAQTLDREVHESDVEPVRRSLEAVVPSAAGRHLGGKVCMYALTPDRHFIIAPHPHDDRVVVAGGFSGHGFKFSPVVGEIVCDLLTDKGPQFDIGFLSPKRFSEGAAHA